MTGAPAMAHPVQQPLLAGKHPVGMSTFRPSSQDGQYRPFQAGSETLRLESMESLERKEPGKPSFPRPVIAPTSSPERLRYHNESYVAPTPPSVKPKTDKGTPKEKGWVDLPSRKRLREPDSPRSIAIRLH